MANTILFYYFFCNYFIIMTATGSICVCQLFDTTQPDNNNYLSLRVEIYLLWAACKLSRQFLLHYSVFCLLNWSAKKNSFLSMKLSENSKDTLLRLLRHIFIHINHCYKRERKAGRRKRGRLIYINIYYSIKSPRAKWRSLFSWKRTILERAGEEKWANLFKCDVLPNTHTHSHILAKANLGGDFPRLWWMALHSFHSFLSSSMCE